MANIDDYIEQGKLFHERRLRLGIYDVQDVANRYIEAVMIMAQVKHEPQSFAAQGLEYHIEAAFNHLEEYRASHREEDLTHALCRMAMAVHAYERGIHATANDRFYPTDLDGH